MGVDLQGSLAVIERFFDAELAVEDAPAASRYASISPQRIAALPASQLDRLDDALHNAEMSARIESDLSTLDEPPTLILAEPGSGARVACRVLGIIGPALAADPLAEIPLPWSAARDSIVSDLQLLAELRPLIMAGHLSLFSARHAASSLIFSSDEIGREAWDRSRHFERFLDPFAEDHVEPLPSFDSPGYRPPLPRFYPSMILGQLNAALEWSVNSFDASRDSFVRKFLGEGHQLHTLRMVTEVSWPRLDRLAPTDLAALMSSNRVYKLVQDAFEETLEAVPDVLLSDVDEAVRWIDRALALKLRAASQRLESQIHRFPSLQDVASAGLTVGATIVAGSLDSSTLPAIGVGAAGGLAGLAASWLSQRRTRRQEAPAMRALQHLSSPT